MNTHRFLLLALPLSVVLLAGGCRTVTHVEGLRAGERARLTDDLFPGAIPEDDEGWPSHVVTRIVDAWTGAPLPGATLDAVTEKTLPTPATWPPVRRAVADGDGWARLRVDDIRDEFAWYFADADGYALEADMAPPESFHRLLPGVDVPVVVRDRFDRPVPDVHLGLILGCGHTPDVREAVTDAEGRAVLADIEPGRGELWPTRSGYKAPGDDISLSDSWRPGDPPEVLRMTAGGWARGVVLDASGTPAPGVGIITYHRHRGPCTVTDEDGRFVITGLHTRDSIEIHLPGEDGRSVAQTEVPPVAEEMTIRLPGDDREPVEWHEVSVRVVDASTWEGIGDIVLHAIHDSDYEGDREITDEEGRATLRLPAGACTIHAMHDGGVYGTGQLHVRVPQAAGDEPVLALDEQPTVRVRLEGFPDEAQRKRSDFHTWFVLATERGEREVKKAVLAGEPIAVPADGPWALYASVGDHERIVHGPVPADGAPLVVRAPRPHEVVVRLEDEKGRPVPGFVRLHRYPRWDGDDPDDVARAQWRVPTSFAGGHYYLAARPADEEHFQPTVVEIALPPGEGRTVDVGVVRFRPQGEPLLRVVRADGTPVEAELTIENLSVHQTTRTDEEGALFEAVTPLEGARVTVSDPDGHYLPFTTDLAGDRPWTLAWPSGGVTMVVTDEHDQSLESGFVVLADGAMVEAGSSTHEVRGLAAGPHEIVVTAPDRMACVIDLVLEEGEVRALQVKLGPRGGS